MKLTKLTILATAATLAICTSGARASIATVTNYSKLNIALTVKTNIAPTASGKVTKYAVQTAKITNKTLLALFASANFANTTWPAGAQLVVGWDEPLSGDVLVVDKTGTNILYDASSDYYATDTEYFYLDFLDKKGAVSATDNENDPGYITWTWFNNGYFELDDEAGNTFLSGAGPCTEIFSQKWDANGNYTKWTDSEKYNPANAGVDVVELNNNNGGTLSGTIGATGKGQGLNSYLYNH